MVACRLISVCCCKSTLFRSTEQWNKVVGINQLFKLNIVSRPNCSYSTHSNDKLDGYYHLLLEFDRIKDAVSSLSFNYKPIFNNPENVVSNENIPKADFLEDQNGNDMVLLPGAVKKDTLPNPDVIQDIPSVEKINNIKSNKELNGILLLIENKINTLLSPSSPGPEECCQSGCAVCVWDIYNDDYNTYTATFDYLLQSKTAIKKKLGMVIKEDDNDKPLEKAELDPSIIAFMEMEAAMKKK